MENISEHITYKEATESETAIRKGIQNIPNDIQVHNMQLVAERCFEPLRKWCGKPLKVSSFFRCEKLNKAIGGSSTSQHCEGKAIDIQGMDGLTNKEIFYWLKENVNYCQMIWEYGTKEEPAWVHISYDEKNNKKEKLRCEKINGKTVYSQWLD